MPFSPACFWAISEHCAAPAARVINGCTSGYLAYCALAAAEDGMASSAFGRRQTQHHSLQQMLSYRADVISRVARTLCGVVLAMHVYLAHAMHILWQATQGFRPRGRLDAYTPNW